MINNKPTNLSFNRPKVEGKFITVGNEKFYIKGVTYGTFAPNEEEVQFPEPYVVEQDFALMEAHGINSVRTYTVPPTYLLNLAQRHGLKVMVGLPWEQHITFLDDDSRVQDIIRRVQEGVRSCSNHPAVLCYTVGNEIPAPIVRWYGPERVEKFIHTLYKAIKAVDPEGLVTYVNYPTTEYLQLPFLDFDCFNVYLETEEKLSIYLSRLHNLTGDRPLVLAEIGLDSQRNSLEHQAFVLDWQIRTILGKGCAGTFVFAWTDEWWRGGFPIDDWDFGLVDRDRQPKPALAAVAKAFEEAPFASQQQLPKMSVVVCSYNGASTIRDTMEGLLKVDYPDLEVIVVNDGSTDKTAEIVSEYPFQLISTENRGLSNARNTGIYAATGDVVAFIDDDAYPDVHWLRYLAFSYLTTNHGGIGGPNLLPANDGPIATCVANAPGGPVHVLTTDEIAEHIPGCNMSFRRDVLLEIGGLDPIYRSAGDDVDLCWRVQLTGRTIGFHPAAMVWHHRRNSIKAYWKQQKGYGRAEALLEQKWPERYNRLGHLSWTGQIYGNGLTQPIEPRRGKIFHGIWGTAPFQSVYQPAPNLIALLPLMPEWYLLIGFLGFLSILSLVWAPLLWAAPVALLALSVLLLQAGISATNASFPAQSGTQRFKYWALTTWLHFIQPLARLYGRFTYGLTPWRRRGPDPYQFSDLFRHSTVLTKWSETWYSTEEWLTTMEKTLMDSSVRIRPGGTFDKWDLQIGGGFCSVVRGVLVIEEHGAGKQLLRFKCWTKYSMISNVILAILIGLATLAVVSGQPVIGTILGLLASLILKDYFSGTARAMATLKNAFLLPITQPESDYSETGMQEELEELISVENTR
jgi:cellulose synthase/poly-beta-1,6-N-acetylglucosamine synthase-like glycosyltransferase